MPKNTACPAVPRVTDPITDQEIAFARLILSGTMNNRRAAKAVGLNPETAVDTEAKPRVRAYMIEHSAAVKEKLVDQKSDGLRKLNFGRDQILSRLWELATLSHEATRGIIAGQIKALAMIVSIEGLIPDRRLSPSATQPPIKADIYTPEWLRQQQHQPAGEGPGDAVAAEQSQPAAPPVPNPEPAAAPASETANGSWSPNLDPAPTSPLNPFIKPEALNRIPAAFGLAFDAVLDRANIIRPSFSPNGRFSRRRR